MVDVVDSMIYDVYDMDDVIKLGLVDFELMFKVLLICECIGDVCSEYMNLFDEFLI